MSLWGEFKRRKILQVAATYAVVSWLLIQIVSTVEAPLSLPEWFDTAVIVLLAIGFPITMIISWAFDVTPKGIVLDAGDAAQNRRNGRRIEYVLLGLLMVAISWIGYREFGSSHQVSIDSLPNSIAVLPFENVSPNEDDAYFAIGLHDEVINQLAKLSDLRVISRTTVLRYGNSELSVPEIARELRVSNVLEGTVRYADGRIRVTTQLIDAATDRHLWSETYEREFENVFVIESDIAMNVANAMRVEFSPEEQARIEKVPTTSPQAYALYLRASELQLGGNLFVNVATAGLDPALDLLNQATEIDSSFAEAYAAKARIYLLLGDSEQMLANARRAQEIDPVIGRVDAYIGTDHIIHGRYEEAGRHADRALTLSPNDVETLQFAGRIYGMLERNEEALRVLQRGRELHPYDNLHTFANITAEAGDLEGALQLFRQQVERNPSAVNSYLDMSLVLSKLSQKDEALIWIETAERLMGEQASELSLSALTFAYGYAGDIEAAQRVFRRFEQASTGDPVQLARAYLGIGDYDRAIAQLERAAGTQSDPRGYITRIRIRNNTFEDPMLDSPVFADARSRL